MRDFAFRVAVSRTVAVPPRSPAAEVRPIEPGPRSLFAASVHGFAILHIEPERLTVDLVNTELETPLRHAPTMSG